MKIAEALNERASLRADLSNLKNRMCKNAQVQEGDKPAEDVRELMDLYISLNDKLTKLVIQINHTNHIVKNKDGLSLADLIAKRDSYKSLAKTYDELYDAAIIERDRFSRNEIRYETTVDAAEIQKSRNEFSKQYRILDTEIQGINWTTDLVE